MAHEVTQGVLVEVLGARENLLLDLIQQILCLLLNLLSQALHSFGHFASFCEVVARGNRVRCHSCSGYYPFEPVSEASPTRASSNTLPLSFKVRSTTLPDSSTTRCTV